MKKATITLSFSTKVDSKEQAEEFFNKVVNSMNFGYEIEEEEVSE